MWEEIVLGFHTFTLSNFHTHTFTLSQANCNLVGEKIRAVLDVERNCIRGDEGLSLTAPTDHTHFYIFLFLFLSVLCVFDTDKYLVFCIIAYFTICPNCLSLATALKPCKIELSRHLLIIFQPRRNLAKWESHNCSAVGQKWKLIWMQPHFGKQVENLLIFGFNIL